MRLLSRVAAVLLSASLLAACGGAGNGLPKTVQPHTVRPMCGQPLARMHSMFSVVGCPTPSPDPGFNQNPCVVTCDGPTPIADPCLKDPRLPSCVATIPPSAGQGCDGSQLTLGSQWPVNTTDYAHEVVNIDALSANDNNGNPGIAGWVYETGNGDWYVQGATDFTTFWAGLAKSIPGIGAVIQNLDSSDAIIPASSSAATQIINYFNSHDGKAGSCFSGHLTS